MRGQHGVTSAIDKSEYIVLGDFVAKSNATRTKNATFVIERNPRSELHRLRLFHLVFEKARAGRPVLDAEFLQLTFARLVADRTIEWMIDEQEFHYAAATLLNHGRTGADPHPLGDILGATYLRTRHPVDNRFAVDAELRFAIGTHSRHAHL